MRVVTYADPFKLKDNSKLWDEITSHPHFCASDTLVQGLISYYGRESFIHIRPIQDLIDTFYATYTKNSVNDMQMFLNVSDHIRKWSESPMKKAFLFNKAEIVKAIQLLIPLEFDSSKFNKAQLTNNQIAFLEIFDAIKESDCYQAFSALSNLSMKDYKQALKNTGIAEITHICKKSKDTQTIQNLGIRLPFHTIEQAIKAAEILISHQNNLNASSPWGCLDKSAAIGISELKSAVAACNDHSEEYYRKIIIHGLHKIPPILYYMVKHLEKSFEIEVVFLINYANNIPEIFSTWERIYSWCDTIFEYASPLDLDLGHPFAKDMALVASGYAPKNTSPEKLIKFDNLTSFALHCVGNTYSEAKKSNPQSPLPKMKTQYYAVNGKQCNEVLQMCFPEQFGKKPFLTYPIGQFIIGLYNMWDFEKKEIHFDLSHLAECAVSGYFQRNNNILEIIRKVGLYFSDIESYTDYIARIKLLSDGNEKRKHEYTGWEKISFFTLSSDEINDFSCYIEELNSVATKLFYGMSDQVDYLSHFKHLIEIIATPSSKTILTNAELNLIEEIKARLSVDTNASVLGNSRDLKDALAFFLSSSLNDSSNWIVRDFEQIDGAVLLSSSTRAESYHFALLSNSHMLKQESDELPWPLTYSLFTSYREVNEALTVVTSEYRERRNFLKYILFYGSFFSKKKLEFSYISEENGEEQKPYYIFTAMGTQDSPFKDPLPPMFNYKPTYEPVQFCHNPTDAESAELFSVCPFKFLLKSLIKTNIVYYSEFHLKYYLAFYLSYVVQKKAPNKHQFNSVLETELLELKKFFPFWGDVIFEDIKKSASDSLNKYFTITNKIERRKSNFLIAKWVDPDTHWTLNFEKADVPHRAMDYMNSDRLYPSTDEIPCKSICDNCNFENICLRNYYDALADN